MLINICRQQAQALYGNPLPEIIDDRLKEGLELNQAV